MLINLTPLKKYPDFRNLFLGQFVSFFGSMISYVAVPYQVYHLTKDNWYVGALGIVQLIPVLVFGIIGGAIADRLNRRRLILYSEVIMCLTVLGLALNSLQESPSILLIFILVAILQGVLGFHRPAMEAMTQKIVSAEDYASIGVLGSFRYSVSAIAGPSLAGLVIAQFGISAAYFFDVITFMIALYFLFKIRFNETPEKSDVDGIEQVKQGLRFAVSKPELIGTYVIDIVAMVFAFPVALFPALSESFGGAKSAGILFSSMAVGALVMTVFSGWTAKIKVHGRMVVISAVMWAFFICVVGFTNSLWSCFLFLALAGAADMLSGLYRQVIWNHTVPNEMRGRLSGIEMISYMSGPLLGNARAGWVASKYSVSLSLWSGGLICFAAVILTAFFLPKFWRYTGK
ncbi:MAG: MFS transporter [Bdellovibrionaceae bacterium]|nr:MFS transporter [Pseudobdellovibrionaceae bacterium]